LISGTDTKIPSAIDTQIGGATFPIYLSAFDDVCNQLYVKNPTIALHQSEPALLDSDAAGKFSTTAFTKLPSGRYRADIKYNDVGRVTLNAAGDVYDDPDSATPLRAATTMSTFIIQPDALKIYSVKNEYGNSLTPAGVNKAIAGSDVTIALRGLLADGKPAPSFGGPIGGYNVNDNINFSLPLSLYQPVGGFAPSATVDAAAASCTKDTEVNTYNCSKTFSYSEAGSINLSAYMETFLGSTFQKYSPSITVGDFVPYSFEVVDASGSLAKKSCSFAYEGQPFSVNQLSFTLEARNKLGEATKNYDGNTWTFANNITPYVKFSDATHAFSSVSYNPSPVFSWTNPTDFDGRATYSFDGTSANSSMSYTGRTSSPTNAFTAAVMPMIKNITGDFGACINRISNGDCSSSEIPLTLPASGSIPAHNFLLDSDANENPFYIRYGRIIVKNANGAEIRPLKVPVQAQYWNGSGFVTNDLDNCTNINAENIVLGNYTGKLSQNITAQNALAPGDVALTKGKGNIILQAPNVTGQATVTLDLSAASLNYLNYFLGNNPSGNPSGKATFGIYGGRAPVLFIQQIYGR